MITIPLFIKQLSPANSTELMGKNWVSSPLSVRRTAKGQSGPDEAQLRALPKINTILSMDRFDSVLITNDKYLRGYFEKQIMAV